jgi:predicted metal-dependent hydrolase
VPFRGAIGVVGRDREAVPVTAQRLPRLLELEGETVTVLVRESSRARSLRVRLGPELPLEAIVPRRVGDAELDRFLHDRRDWIARKLAETRAAAARANRLGLNRRDVVWLGLTPIPIELGDARSPRLRHGRLVVGSGPQAVDAVERWYRRQARERIGRVVAREAARLGVRPGTLAIRDPKTRWGSCSSRGTIGFSWRLVIAPLDVLEYVVVHELCHLRELNHGKRFWRLLEDARPGWRHEAGWLREHGLELSGYRIALTASS